MTVTWPARADYRRASRGVPYCRGSTAGGRVELPTYWSARQDERRASRDAA